MKKVQKKKRRNITHTKTKNINKKIDKTNIPFPPTKYTFHNVHY